MNFSPQYRRSRDYEGHADYSNESQNIVSITNKPNRSFNASTSNQRTFQNAVTCHPLIPPVLTTPYMVGKLGKPHVDYPVD